MAAVLELKEKLFNKTTNVLVLKTMVGLELESVEVSSTTSFSLLAAGAFKQQINEIYLYIIIRGSLVLDIFNMGFKYIS